MKYAITYTDTFRHFDEIDEVIFRFTKDIDRLISNITSTLKKPTQTATIYLADQAAEDFDTILPLVLKIKQEHENMKVIIDFFEHREWINNLQENKIEFFFSDFARNITMIAAMRDLGASEVYLAEDLCFSLHKLQRFRNKGLKFRVWPDIAQTIVGTHGILSPLTEFFIRPEDLDLYEGLIDTVEFMRQGTRVNVIYEVYKQGQWLGSLDLVIMNLDEHIGNTSITPYFGRQRLHCEKRCLWSECDVCARTQELGELFENANIALVQKKKNREIPETYMELLTRGEINGSESDEKSMLKDSGAIAGDANKVSKEE